VVLGQYRPARPREIGERERGLAHLDTKGRADRDLRVFRLVPCQLQRDGCGRVRRFRAVREELVQRVGRPILDRGRHAWTRPCHQRRQCHQGDQSHFVHEVFPPRWAMDKMKDEGIFCLIGPIRPIGPIHRISSHTKKAEPHRAIPP
jgi:hypothetical protein